MLDRTRYKHESVISKRVLLVVEGTKTFSGVGRCAAGKSACDAATGSLFIYLFLARILPRIDLFKAERKF